jgi:hypothetical protein
MDFLHTIPYCGLHDSFRCKCEFSSRKADWRQFYKLAKTPSAADDEQDHGDEEVDKCQDCSDDEYDPDLELPEFPPEADDV